MEEPSPQVLRIDFAREPEQQSEPPEPSQPEPPPHLSHEARRAWADVVGAATRLKEADERWIELAAVLLAHLRQAGPAVSLAVRLNIVLIGLGLPAGARAEIQPEHALAVFSRARRAQDAAGRWP